MQRSEQQQQQQPQSVRCSRADGDHRLGRALCSTSTESWMRTRRLVETLWDQGSRGREGS